MKLLSIIGDFLKKFFAVIWKMLKSNWLLKIMALLFALILWSYVLAETDPPRVRMMEDITVRYDNVEDLRSKELDISGSLSDVLDTVDVRLEVRQSNLKYLSDENVRAYIDLSSINGKGEHVLNITAQSTYGEVLKVSPSEVTLYVDDYVTKQVPVNVNLSGSVPSGYYASAPKITPGVIYVSGARVDVDKVVSAECEIDLNGQTEGYSKSVEVTLLDEFERTIDKSIFSESVPSVIVDLEVMAKKTVPVDISEAILGKEDLAPGYEITQVSVEPESVDIVGKKAIIDTISAIKLVPHSVSGADTDIVALLDYQGVEGVSVLGEAKAQVFISIREITEIKEFGEVVVGVKNLSDGLDVLIEPAAVDVTVIAGIPMLSGLDKADIVPYVDVEGLLPGIYSLRVLFEVPEGFAPESFTASFMTVTVTVIQD